MNFGKHQFPHPVLTNNTDDVDGEISVLDTVSETIDKYIVNLEYKIEEPFLKKLFKEKRVEIFCEFTCTATIYRNYVKSNELDLEFLIPKKDVKGNIEISSYLIASFGIDNYLNPSAHSEYQNYPSVIEKGDVLGYFGTFNFNAEVNYRKLKAVSSFLTIEERSDIEMTEFDIDSEKIIIKLPTQDFQIYKRQPIAKNPEFSPIFHSSLVLPVVVFALMNINNYEDKLWAIVIRLRMKDEELKYLNIDEPGETFKIAQQLLGNPINRLLKSLEKISERI